MSGKAATEEQGSEPKKKGSLIKIIILAVLVLGLAGGGYVGYLKFFKAAHSDAAEPKKEEKVVHEMDTFLVNLADPGGKRYLKVSMKLELNNAKVAEELTEKNFQLRDTVLLLLSSKEYDEVSGYSGKMSLKQEIMGQLNRAIQSGQIKEVYFTEFLVQ